MFGHSGGIVDFYDQFLPLYAISKQCEILSKNAVFFLDNRTKLSITFQNIYIPYKSVGIAHASLRTKVILIN